MSAREVNQIDVVELAVSLRRSCLRHGLQLSTSAAVFLGEAFRSLPEVGPRQLYYASRAICVHRPEERAIFDLAFAHLVDDGPEFAEAMPEEVIASSRGDEFDLPDERSGEGPTSTALAYSRRELLQDRDITSCSEQELETISDALGEFTKRQIRSYRRRRRADKGTSPALDIRRSIIRARSTEGEIVELAYQAKRRSRIRVVFLVDISGSMEAYVPAFLRLVYGISRSELRVEIFSLGTRLTRLSRAIETTSVEEALGEIRSSVRDWSGGTRLGDSLGIFNDVFGIRGIARGATVVVVSDGLDRGDPELLGRQMQRLHFVARQLIWVNPLKAGANYEPLARGMSAALPNVDAFISGHSLSSLIDLVGLIFRVSPPLAPPLATPRR